MQPRTARFGMVRAGAAHCFLGTTRHASVSPHAPFAHAEPDRDQAEAKAPAPNLHRGNSGSSSRKPAHPCTAQRTARGPIFTAKGSPHSSAQGHRFGHRAVHPIPLGRQGRAGTQRYGDRYNSRPNLYRWADQVRLGTGVSGLQRNRQQAPPSTCRTAVTYNAPQRPRTGLHCLRTVRQLRAPRERAESVLRAVGRGAGCVHARVPANCG